MINAQVGSPKVISATGTVKAIPGMLQGFFCNSTSSGTLVLRDGGASGTAISGTITPSAGVFYPFPATFGTDLHVTIANTLNVTFFVN